MIKEKNYVFIFNDSWGEVDFILPILKKVSQNTPAEEIQTKIYTAGKENGYSDNLRDWFKLIYEVCFGEENGPRMGFFISFFGVKETIDLMEKKLRM